MYCPSARINRHDAEQFLKELKERLLKFGLELHPEKTRLIEFGRFAAEHRNKRGEVKPETFVFLGFTHYCGTTSKGVFTVWRQTAGKRMRAKLKQIKAALMCRMHRPVAETGEWLARVVTGYYRFHAVPGNSRTLARFRHRLCRIWRHVLLRRSQRGRLTWARLQCYFRRWLPVPKILHPYPCVRFDATHPR